MTRRYYTPADILRWRAIQGEYTYSKRHGLRLAADYGRKLAERDMRDPSRLKLER